MCPHILTNMNMDSNSWRIQMHILILFTIYECGYNFQFVIRFEYIGFFSNLYIHFKGPYITLNWIFEVWYEMLLQIQ